MRLKIIAQITYFVPPEGLTLEDRARLADLLSSYAADILKDQLALPMGHTVTFSVVEGEAANG